MKDNKRQGDLLAECLEALRIMVRTYPYHPPCLHWEEQVYAHGKAKTVLAKAKELR